MGRILGNYILNFSVFSEIASNTLSKIYCLKMTAGISNMAQMSVLNVRLTKAETQLKILTNEISEIKCQMLRLEKTSSSRLFSTTSGDLAETDSQPAAKRIKTDFEYENDHVVVYTDGACENNGYNGAKAGIGVWFADNHPFNVSEPVEGRATNNVGEIQACIRAVKIALENDIKKLCIKSDSQFVIKAMTSWIKRWKKNNWKLASGGHVKNKVDFEILDKVCGKLTSIRWVHVAAHKGIPGNEAADKLARDGALRYKL